eukprot:15462209-Alexandrium_andersonii.AAC.1
MTGKALVVLSLFDGIGVIWHALGELLTRTCLWGRLAAAWSVEVLPHQSDAVVHWWATTDRLGPAIPVHRLANVWDLLDGRGA